MADSLRNHSVELKDEVENLNDELNNGKHTFFTSANLFVMKSSKR